MAEKMKVNIPLVPPIYPEQQLYSKFLDPNNEREVQEIIVQQDNKSHARDGLYMSWVLWLLHIYQ